MMEPNGFSKTLSKLQRLFETVQTLLEKDAQEKYVVPLLEHSDKMFHFPLTAVFNTNCASYLYMYLQVMSSDYDVEISLHHPVIKHL